MGPLSPLELFQPEIQAQIMCSIPDIKTLYSLLRASPRFYQVFNSRRDFHLTELARWQFHWEVFPFAYDTVKLSAFPKPLSRQDVLAFTTTFWDNKDFMDLIMPPEITLPLIKLGVRIRWFADDVTSNSLEILSQLGKLVGLEQDSEALRTKLSSIELARLQRAFCRFETHWHLFAPEPSGSPSMTAEEQTHNFHEELELEEVEELACVRDYIVRRLWAIFDLMEDVVVAGEPSTTRQGVCSHHNFFTDVGKHEHILYMERLMSQGLEVLQAVFANDLNSSTEIVISNCVPLEGYLSDALEKMHRMTDDIMKAMEARSKTPLQFSGDDIRDSSIGWLWAHDWHPGYESGDPALKGLRDWGYVFWDEQRVKASGILDRW